jgi:hypothetical protein
MELVKFIAAGAKQVISDYYEYVDRILDELHKQGYIGEYKVEPEVADYPSRICISTYEEDYIVDLFFEFNTFKNVKQLMIDIRSDNYEVDINKSYLEKLKLDIKKIIIKDWDKLVWLFDADAYILSSDLYSCFYVTENKIRRFINEFMVKTFGTDWWDILSDQTIKNKYKSRYAGYKTVVPGFNNVDDHLLSIDVGDLLKVLTMKKMVWTPSYDKDIEVLISGVIAGNECKIIEKIQKQLTVQEDFWEKYFKDYFDTDFFKNYRDFELNRNHVAHNKILDRIGYNYIRKSIGKIDKCFDDALVKLYKNEKSIEQLQVEVQKYKEVLIETKQNDSGITIRNHNRIISVFEEALEEKFVDVEEALRFRQDIELSRIGFDCDRCSGILFSANSKLYNKKLDFFYSMDINEDEGAESILTITCLCKPNDDDETIPLRDFKVTISYTNGEVEYNNEEGYYMPITNDGISESDLDNYLDEVIDLINVELQSLKDYVDSISYERIKDGGSSPIADGVYCDECEADYICIDESIAEVGICLNCGAHYKISECERCEQYFIDYEDAEIKICDQCKEYYDRE